MISPAPLTLRLAFERHYLPHAVNICQSTVARYYFDVLRWERHTTNQPIDEIDTQTFLDYRRNCLSDGLAPETIESTVRTVKAILRLCGPASERTPFGLGLMHPPPWSGRRLRLTRKHPDVPTLDSLAAIYLQAGQATWPRLDTPPDVFWRAFITVAFFTGLRLRDLVQTLTWDCIELDKISVRAKKTDKEHILPVHPIVAQHLRTLFRTDTRVFPIPRSTTHLVRRELRLMSLRAGVEKITPQKIRRLAGTEYERAVTGSGQLLLGHTLGASDYYIAVPKILADASALLKVPPEFRAAVKDRQRTLF